MTPEALRAIMTPATLRALADAARSLAALADAALVDATANYGDAMIPELEAARLAGVSVRVLRDARRAGDLRVYGKQRSRTLRRSDLVAWIESRRVPIVADVLDTDGAMDVDRRAANVRKKRGGGVGRAREKTRRAA